MEGNATATDSGTTDRVQSTTPSFRSCCKFQLSIDCLQLRSLPGLGLAKRIKSIQLLLMLLVGIPSVKTGVKNEGCRAKEINLTCGLSS